MKHWEEYAADREIKSIRDVECGMRNAELWDVEDAVPYNY